MEQLIFNGRVYNEVIISELPAIIINIKSKVKLYEGACIGNSYEISKALNGVNIVEGYLVTYFSHKPPDSVGHAWNERYCPKLS